ncbi:hypothetical protein [Kribbella sp. NPDC004536]|uniref:hypothetical protein n=1 Tax=Kribbella sp. NPDC004536 TaxID=3364106 RepID=UPI0036771D1F
MTFPLKFTRRLATWCAAWVAVLGALLTVVASPASATGAVSVWFGDEFQTFQASNGYTYVRVNYGAFVTLDHPEQYIHGAEVYVSCWGYRDHQKVTVFQSNHTQDSPYPLQVYTPGGGILLDGSFTVLKGTLLNLNPSGTDRITCGATYYGQPQTNVSAPEVTRAGDF